MNQDELNRIYSRMNRLREKGILPTLTPSDIDNEPTALAYTNFTKAEKPLPSYNSDILHEIYLQGYKMGLLGIDEAQLEAEYIAFKNKVDKGQE